MDKLISDAAFLSKENYLDKLIMLTMSDRKVYIGTVLAEKEIFNRFIYGQTEFIFCPIYSGYRHKDTLEVIITTNYKDAEPNLVNFNTTYQIILNKKNIVSATKVNLDTLLNFTDKDEILNALIDISNKEFPVLISMKNKNLYIGYLLDDYGKYSLIGDVNYISIKLSYHVIFEKDKLNVKQYYDYSNIEDFYMTINFKEIESMSTRFNPEEGIWGTDGKISAEILKNIFNYKIIDL